MKELSLKEIQEQSYIVLRKIDEICKKEDITYFLAYGTLIGAVRHNDYIPWDDDVDIWMPREDYKRFINYCINHKEKIKGFELHHYRTNKKYIYPIARFSNKKFKIVYENTKEYGLGVFVDIYPLDGIDVEDKRYLKSMQRLFKLAQTCGVDHFIATNSVLRNILKYPYYLISRLIYLPKLLEYIDKKAQKYSFNESEKVLCTTWFWGKIEICSREVFENSIMHKFGKYSFPIPKDYHQILTIKYGDYMKLPPESERCGHHFYKVYRKSENSDI